MSIMKKAMTKSIGIFHASAGSCNNCDIELLDLLCPRYDVERLGVHKAPSIRHADVLMVTGAMNRKCAVRIKQLYEQAPKPVLVVAIGTCACGQNFFRDSYHTVQPLDELLPEGAVSVYVPGCPPKPEALITGIIKALDKFKSPKQAAKDEAAIDANVPSDPFAQGTKNESKDVMND